MRLTESFGFQIACNFFVASKQKAKETTTRRNDVQIVWIVISFHWSHKIVSIFQSHWNEHQKRDNFFFFQSLKEKSYVKRNDCMPNSMVFFFCSGIFSFSFWFEWNLLPRILFCCLCIIFFHSVDSHLLCKFAAFSDEKKRISCSSCLNVK